MAKKIVPMNATFDELCTLKRDHAEVNDFCLLTDSWAVYLSEQKVGEHPTQRFEISRKEFNKLILWYTTNSMRPKRRGSPKRVGAK